jgi:hypothetical protein
MTKKLNRLKQIHRLGHDEELGQEPTSKKAHAFTEHLAEVFHPHPSENESKGKETLIQLLETPYQLELPINGLRKVEVQEVISSLNSIKSSGYDLITGKILKELPTVGIKYLIQLFNAVLLNGYFPAKQKVIFTSKPGKCNELTFYHPVSFLLRFLKSFS